MAALNVKLGRLPKQEDPGTLKLETYLTPALAPSPAATDWTTKVQSWPMFENDTVGDCTCAAAGHDIEAWTITATGVEAQLTNQQVIAAYSAITGYDPATGANDNGANELPSSTTGRAQKRRVLAGITSAHSPKSTRPTTRRSSRLSFCSVASTSD